MRGHSLNIAAIVLLSAFTLTSCSRSPLAPEVATDPANTSFAGIQIDDTPGGIEAEGGIYTTAQLTEKDGGVIQVGRFKLIVPAHALRMDATITLRQPKVDEMFVQFIVTPAAASRFSQPVTLVADCSNDTVEELQNENMYWLDGGWDSAPMTSLDTNQRSLSARTNKLGNSAKVEGGKKAARVDNNVPEPGTGDGGDGGGEVFGR